MNYDHIPFANISGKSTAKINEKHINSKECIVISHPGWDRLRFGETNLFGIISNGYFKSEYSKMPLEQKVEMVKMAYGFSQENFHALRSELLLEELISHGIEKDIPVVLTVPSYIENNKIVALDNEYSLFLDYFKRISDSDNIYIFPTTSGTGMSVFEDIDDNSPFIDQLNSVYEDPEKNPFSKSFRYNGWEKVYFAGGEITRCLFGTSMYFLKSNLDIDFLGDYMIPAKKRCRVPFKSHLDANVFVYASMKHVERKEELLSRGRDYVAPFRNAHIIKKEVELVRNTHKKCSRILGIPKNKLRVRFGRAREIII